MALAFPPIYLLGIGFEKIPHDLHALERKIGSDVITMDIREAHVVLGKVTRKVRAEHELRKLGLMTEDVDPDEPSDEDEDEQSQKKRRKLDGVEGREMACKDSKTESGIEKEGNSPAKPAAQKPVYEEGIMKVLKLAWYTDSVRAGKLLPIEEYLVYEGRILNKAKPPSQLPPTQMATSFDSHPFKHNYKPAGNSFHSHHRSQPSHHSQPALLQETTEDHDAIFPPIPEYLNSVYCCERPTTLHCANEEFIAQLRIMKQGRMLEGEEMNARAYNSGIATIASYPYTITSPFEIQRLPHCGNKIATIWREWHDTGSIQEAQNFINSEKFQSLSTFIEIHEVGQKTAMDFWNRGWRDLDDVIEFGWSELNRIQRIGVKYWDDFQQRIPRPEVEEIANKVLEYTQRIHPDFQMVICGGYRRGKATSGDVDVILSNPDPNETTTQWVLEPLLQSLEDAGYIQHRLEWAETNSKRSQKVVSLKPGSLASHGSGFDTLDHAFVVWQDPSWPTSEEDLANNPQAKNPNLHRRVDIIISPWKTAGCAVLGWSGGTMFERDLRSYCKKVRKCKFDSSGIRDVETGEWVDLERGAETMLEKERMVFGGLGLEWREPTERCTD